MRNAGRYPSNLVELLEQLKTEAASATNTDRLLPTAPVKEVSRMIPHSTASHYSRKSHTHPWSQKGVR